MLYKGNCKVGDTVIYKLEGQYYTAKVLNVEKFTATDDILELSTKLCLFSWMIDTKVTETRNFSYLRIT